MNRAEHAGPSIIAELNHRTEEQPGKLAIVDGSTLLTYRELLTEFETRGVWLEQAGVRSGDRVALVAENSADYLVWAAAVWHASAVLVTIYASTTANDLAYCLEDCDPVLVLVDERTEDKVRSAVSADLPIVLMSQTPALAGRLRTAATANPETQRGRLGLICYTSGTTSRPKAVMVSVEALHHGATTYADQWHLGPSDRTVVAMPLAWLYGLDTTAFATLVRGGAVVVLRRGRPEMMIEAVSAHQATFLPGVTTMFTKMVGYLDSLAQRPDLGSLRVCLSAGEPRNEKTFARWREYTGLPVFDNYSASECFPIVTYDSEKDPDTVAGAAGTVVPGSELKVVNPDGTEVEQGEIGEAWGRSPGLMLGYWRNPEQTAEVLTEDGWYRTKDLVRVDEAGYVYVVGRMSDMIIRGGSNVSPAEVERVLRMHSDVADAVVIGLPDDVYGQQVAVALVPSTPDIDPKAVLAFCSDHLAAYKVPTASRLVDTLPLNANTGKVDKRQVASLFAVNDAASAG